MGFRKSFFVGAAFFCLQTFAGPFIEPEQGSPPTSATLSACARLLASGMGPYGAMMRAALERSGLDGLWPADLQSQRLSLLPLVTHPDVLTMVSTLVNADAQWRSGNLRRAIQPPSRENLNIRTYPRVIVGTGPVSWVLLNELRAKGDRAATLVIDRSSRFASNFAKPIVTANSNSTHAPDRLQSPRIGPSQGDFNAIPGSPVGLADVMYGGRKPPLPQLHHMFSLLFEHTLGRARANGIADEVLFGVELIRVRQNSSDYRLVMRDVQSGTEFEIFTEELILATGGGAARNPLTGPAALRLEEILKTTDAFLMNLRQGEIQINDVTPVVYNYQQLNEFVEHDRFAYTTMSGLPVLVAGHGDSGVSVIKWLLGVAPEMAYGQPTGMAAEPAQIFWYGTEYDDAESFLKTARPFVKQTLESAVKSGRVIIKKRRLENVVVQVNDREAARVRVQFDVGDELRSVGKLILCTGQNSLSALEGLFDNFSGLQSFPVSGTYPFVGPAEGKKYSVALQLGRGDSRGGGPFEVASPPKPGFRLQNNLEQIFLVGVPAADLVDTDKLISDLFSTQVPPEQFDSFADALKASLLVNLPFAQALAEKLSKTSPIRTGQMGGQKDIGQIDDLLGPFTLSQFPSSSEQSSNIISWTANPRRQLRMEFDPRDYVMMKLGAVFMLQNRSLLPGISGFTPTGRVPKISVEIERLETNSFSVTDVAGVSRDALRMQVFRKYLESDTHFMAALDILIGPSSPRARLAFSVALESGQVIPESINLTILPASR